MGTRGCKICLAVPLLLLIMVITVIVTLFATIFKLREPVMTFHPIGLEEFELPLLYNVTTNSSLSVAMVITTENPNYGSFEHPKSMGYVKYHDMVVGEVRIDAELVPARSQINVTTCTDLMVGKLMQAPQFLSEIIIAGTFNLTSKVTLHGEALMLGIIKFKFTAYSFCNISLNLRSKDVQSECLSKLKLHL